MSEDDPGGPASQLRDAGLRATLPRVTALRWLGSHEGHHSADELAEATGLARTTAFSVLSQLHDRGLVLAVDHDRGTLYEVGRPHHHAVCAACRRVLDVDTAGVGLALPDEVEGMADVTSATLVLHGTCTRCAMQP